MMNHQHHGGGSPPHSATAPAHEGGSHHEMLRDMRRPWLWTNGTVMLLGVWLVSSPATFGYRSVAMTWSDIASGLALTALAGAALAPRFDFIGRWGVALVGVWLQLAPLVFWAPDAVAYVNDTLVGALAITLSILVPMMPGMAHHMAMMKPGPDIPPGWTYCPSSWHQRLPMIVFGFIGWMISRYLAAFQLGYISELWDPFFGDGTRTVLTSDVSRMFPISDAGLGAFAYTIEMLMAWMGDRKRWRTMPWMVAFFFVLVVPLGLTHIVLVILQPVAVGAWCTLCLAAAAAMLIMIPFTVDEVVATGQFLRVSVREGKPFWRTFFVGDTMRGGGPDERTPRYGAAPLTHAPAVRWGVSVPWTLAASGLLGVWITASPALLDASGAAANNAAVAGLLVLTVAVCSFAEVIRSMRFLNLLVAGWLALTPWLSDGATAAFAWNAVGSALLLGVLTVPRGPVRERYAAWQRLIV